MIVEVIFGTALVVGGMAIARTGGMRGWGVLPWGFLIGIGAYLVLGSPLAMLGIPHAPVIATAGTVLAGAGWWLRARAAGRDVAFSWPAAAAALLVVPAIVGVVRWFDVVTWHVDSLVYMNLGQLVANGTLPDAVGAYSLGKRLLGAPLMHAPSAYSGEFYVTFIAPAIALATIGVLVWTIWRAVEPVWGRARAVIIALLGAAVLATIARFALHAFYVNGHLLAGAALIAFVAAGWLVLERRDGSARALYAAMALMPAVAILTRAEGVLLAALAAMPFVLMPAASPRARALVLGAVGIPAVGYYGAAAVIVVSGGESLSGSNAGGFMPYIGVGVVFLVLAVLAARGLYLPWFRHGPWIAELSLWLAPLVFLVLDGPEVMRDALAGIWWSANPTSGAWGGIVLVLYALALVLAATVRGDSFAVLRVSVTTYLPLMVVVAYLRGGGFRESPQDSFHRMLIQVVPMLVLYVVVALCLGQRRMRGGGATAGPPAAEVSSASR